MATPESLIILIIGIVLLISGLVSISSVLHHTNGPKKSSLLFVACIILVSIFLIITAVISVNTPELSVPDILDDNAMKRLRVYENGQIILEVTDIACVNTANSDVITYTTADGLHHAIRPGDSLVEVSEVE